jgi:ribosomal protein S18 acetylase RimI-like enzyme
MAITVRPAVAGDARDIGRLAQQFAAFLRNLGDQTEFRLTAEAFLRDGLGQPSAFMGIVAEDDGKVLGYLLYHFGYDSDAAARNLHVADLYVERAAQRQGIGTALMRAAAQIAIEAGAIDLIWSVYNDNDLAAAFYQGLGARRITEVFFMTARADALRICSL